jgi:hypothetical protein
MKHNNGGVFLVSTRFYIHSLHQQSHTSISVPMSSARRNQDNISIACVVLTQRREAEQIRTFQSTN